MAPRPPRGLEKSLDTLVRRFFQALQTGGAETTFSVVDFGVRTRLNEQMWRLLRPVVDETMEASLRDGVAIYRKLLEQFNVDRQRMPLTSAALVRRCLNRKDNFLDPPEDQAYAGAVDAPNVARAQYFLQRAHEIYGADAASAGLNLRDVVLDRMGEDASNLPRHAVYVDHVTEAIVVAVRGTASLRDAIMALVTEPAPALGGRGRSHKGILDAVNEMLPEVMEPVCEAAAKHPGYRIVATGHSLGAGTALMLTLTLRHQREVWASRLPENALDRMECFAFAPPPVWAPLDALSAADTRNVYAFCHGTDMIPRSSLRSLQILGARYIAVGDLCLEDSRRMAGILAPEKDSIVDEVLDVVDEVLEETQRDMNTGELTFVDGKAMKLYDNMFVPGQVFHLYPSSDTWSKSAADGAPEAKSSGSQADDTEEAREADAEAEAHVRDQGTTSTTGSILGGGPDGIAFGPAWTSRHTPKPEVRYRIQEIAAERMADAPIIESDYFAKDHTTPAYIRAFQRLELPSAQPKAGRKVRRFEAPLEADVRLAE